MARRRTRPPTPCNPATDHDAHVHEYARWMERCAALVVQYEPLINRLITRVFNGRPGVQYVHDREDLLQEGRHTVWHAACMFDPTLGIQFMTYVYRSILNRFNYLANKGGLIATPSHGMEATHAEQVEKAWQCTAIGTYQHPKLDRPEHNHWLDMLLDEQQDRSLTDPWMLCEQQDSRAASEKLLHALLARLPERERGILWERYAVNATLKEVATKFSISRERVRQICDRALSILRGEPNPRLEKDRERRRQRSEAAKEEQRRKENAYRVQKRKDEKEARATCN